MNTIFLTLFVALLCGLAAHFSNIPVSWEFAAFFGGLLTFVFRVKRHMGIKEEIRYLERNLSEKYSCLVHGDASEQSSELHNYIVQDIDNDNKDRDGLKRIQW